MNVPTCRSVPDMSILAGRPGRMFAKTGVTVCSADYGLVPPPCAPGCSLLSMLILGKLRRPFVVTAGLISYPSLITPWENLPVMIPIDIQFQLTHSLHCSIVQI